MTTSTKTKTKTIIDTKAVYAQAGLYTQSDLKKERDTVAMLDVLEAANVPETHLISPIQGPNKHMSTATPDWFLGLKAAIEAEYPKEVHALIAMSKKAAGNRYVGANNRDGWTKKANSIIGNMRTAYINRLDRKGLIEKGKMGANARTKPVEIKVHELITEARSRIQKADTFECRLDIDVVIKQLSEILKAIA